MWNFVIYLVCMWFGAGVGVFGTALCVMANDRRS